MRFLRATCLALLALTAPQMAVAQSATTAPAMTADTLDRIWSVLDLPEALAIMREEGRAMAADVAEDYLPGQRGDGWTRALSRIYDPQAMDRLMRTAFAEDFAGTDSAPVVRFFDSELGQRIIALETSARRAFLDPETEQAAHEMIASGAVDAGRAALIQEFMDVNDLVSFNTTGAMNTSFAFLTGLSEAELFQMSEADILDQVYGQVDDTRASTEDWLRAYLTMAYQPLSDDDLSAYIAFSRQPEGQRLNRALFAGFGRMYDTQYRELGRAVAQHMTAQDL